MAPGFVSVSLVFEAYRIEGRVRLSRFIEGIVYRTRYFIESSVLGVPCFPEGLSDSSLLISCKALNEPSFVLDEELRNNLT